MASVGKIPTHARLHKRAGSTSSTSSPPLPAAQDPQPATYKRSGETKRVTYHDDPLIEEQGRLPNGPALKIKPYLRKLSSKEETSRIDLSRTAEENERLAGLGMGDYQNASRSVSDVTFVPVGRSRHNRATSNGSQFSTNSGLQRPTAPYAHPMRQTPRPYTPPVSKSYSTSMSEISDDPTDLIMADDYRSKLFEGHHYRSGSIGSLPSQPPPLHIHTSSSFTCLNASQSSVPSSLPTGGRPRGDTLHSIDTLGSPSSGRASLDKAVSFLRSGKSTDDLDAAASRAASIRALRAAYNEKEQAKELRAEKEALRLASRQAKKEQSKNKPDVIPSRARTRSNSRNEKGDIVGKAYNDYSNSHPRALPVTGPARPRASTKTSSAGSANRGAKSTWLGFLAWFRTRLLRLGRKLHVTY